MNGEQRTTNDELVMLREGIVPPDSTACRDFVGKDLRIVSTIGSSSQFAVVSLVPDDGRLLAVEFSYLVPASSRDPFCKPCGGFRMHKRGCPVAPRLAVPPRKVGY